MSEEQVKRCGFVAIVGRPNVGKSTLLNHFMGFKLAITSRKPQTTRHRILGIATDESHQIIFVDTPGVNKKQPNAMNRYLNKTASSTIKSVELALFITDRNIFTEEDRKTLQMLKEEKVPVIWVINKADRLKDKSVLIPHIQELQSQFAFEDVFIISALRGNNLPILGQTIKQALPEVDMFYYPENQKTDKSDIFMAKEFIREKLMRQLGQELPYALTVSIEKFEKTKKLLEISAKISVDKPGHKPIVIGHKGSRLKSVGTQARLELEKYFGQKVFLQLWVKVKENWADDAQSLKDFGYADDL